MRKLYPRLFGFILFGFSVCATAQTSFLIKSFKTPTSSYIYTYNAGYPGDEENDPIPPSYSSSGSSIYVIQVKTVTPFNCAGTNTDNARIAIDFNSGDMGFIMVSEIINAAKFGYQIETNKMLFLNPSVGGSGMNGLGCQVQDISIKVQ